MIVRTIGLATASYVCTYNSRATNAQAEHRRVRETTPKNASGQVSHLEGQKYLKKPLPVLGLGAAGVDYNAMVERYPSPDDKIRVLAAVQSGGGNCANTLTALARLGVDCELLTKVGTDELGETVLNELVGDNVGISRVVRSHATNTAYTYVIIEQESSTRTCLHTPQTEELTVDEVNSMLERSEKLSTLPYSLIHLDSRHTLAALTLAKVAISVGVPISIDAEKNRPPYFDELLPLCSIIFTNEKFPTLYMPAGREDKIAQLFDSTRAQVIVSTFGGKGSVLYVRRGSEFDTRDTNKVMACPLRDIAQKIKLFASIHGILRISRESCPGYDVLRCPAWPLANELVVDTTGAGDAFIGGFLAAHIHNLPLDNCLQLATLVASQKLRQHGTRTGLPTLQDIDHLLDQEKI